MLSKKRITNYESGIRNQTRLSGIFIVSVILASLFLILASHSALAAIDVPTASGLSTKSLADTAVNIINAFLGLVGVIALGIFVYGGYLWMFSAGDPRKIALAKKVLISATIGLIVILLSWAIVQFILNAVGEGENESSCSIGDTNACYDCVDDGLGKGKWVFDIGNGPACNLILSSTLVAKWTDPKDGDSNIPLCRIFQTGFNKNISTGTVSGANVEIKASCTDDAQCGNVFGGQNLGTCTDSYGTLNYCTGNIAALPGVQWNYFDALDNDDPNPPLPDAFEFSPPTEWEADRTYWVHLKDGITNSAGDVNLSGKMDYIFSVGNTTDNTPPTVASIYPNDGDINVCRLKPISAAFSEPMRASSLKDADTLSVADVPNDYASFEISLSDGSIQPADLTFGAFIPDPLSAIYSPKKPYEKNTKYFPILRAGEDTDGNKKVEGAEDVSGNGKPDGIQDACGNFLDQTAGAPYGSPFGDYGDSQGDAVDAPVDYSFTTDNADDIQCDPQIDSVTTSPFYYDPPNVLDGTTGEIVIQGKNFGAAGEVNLSSGIIVNAMTNSCLISPSYYNAGRDCRISWSDNKITIIAPAEGEISNGAVSGSLRVNLGGVGICDLGGSKQCLDGPNIGQVCFSNDECPINVSNIMSVNIASPHINDLSASTLGAGSGIGISGTQFGANPGSIDLIDGAGNRTALDLPCGANSWSETYVIGEIPLATAPGNYTVQIIHLDGRHSNLGDLIVTNDPPGPLLCPIPGFCSSSGESVPFTLSGKRLSAQTGDDFVEFLDKINIWKGNASLITLWNDIQIDGATPTLDDNPAYRARVILDKGTAQQRFSNWIPYEVPCSGRPRVVESAACTTGAQTPSPYKDSTDACINTSAISARFNMDMNDADITDPSNVEVLRCNQGGAFNNGACGTPPIINDENNLLEIFNSGGGEGFKFQPIAGWTEQNYWYRATIRGTVKSADGTAMGTDYVWSFHIADSAANCPVDSISLNPPVATVADGTTVNYTAVPQSANCNFLNACTGLVWADGPNSTITSAGNICNESVHADTPTLPGPPDNITATKEGKTNTASLTITDCGNGIKEGSEQCDDGNAVDTDACSNICKSNSGSCGNGVKEGVEQCDGSDWGAVNKCVDVNASFVSGTLSGNWTQTDDTAGAGGFNLAGNSKNNTVMTGSGAGTSVVLRSSQGYIDISSSSGHTCAVSESFKIWCWGDNFFGQLGNNSTVDSSVPVQVSGIANAAEVSAGNDHSCARLQNGEVWCWGRNSFGKLGNNSTVDSSVPVQVSGIANAAEVSAGQIHSCARLQNGEVWCWGRNNSSQLGNNSTTNSSVPVQVSGIANAAEVSAGWIHSCARLQNNEVWCWGYNFDGQLGNNSTTNSSVPVQVSGIANAAEVSAGSGHSCARLQNGEAWCWGDNTNGQLGNNSTTDSKVPVQVSGIANAADISANMHTCAMLQNGEAWCWGYNSNGQIGNNSTTDSKVPVQVSGIANAADISAGWYHTCTRLQDGNIWCWGGNLQGQLGNGAIAASQLTVVKISPVAELLNGTYASGIFDTAHNSIFKTISWNETLNGQSLKLKVRTCDDAACNGEAGFGGIAQTACSGGGCTIGQGGDLSSLPSVKQNDRYAQYQAEFTTANSAQIPVLDSTSINYEYDAGGNLFCNASCNFDTSACVLNPNAPALSCSDANLTAVWKFDEDSGAVALDSGSSGANDGVLTSESARSSSGCRFGKCLDLNGTDQYAAIPPNLLNFGTNDFTAEGWIKTSTLPNSQVLVSKEADGALPGYTLQIDLTGIAFFRVDGGIANPSQQVVGDKNIADNKWHHIAGVRKGDTISIYIDGIFENSATNAGATSNVDSSKSTLIGAFGEVGSLINLVKGQIDEVRIWNKALEESEIKSIYNQACMNVAAISCSNTNLKAVWKLDENSGIVANDSTANHNDGQLNNSPTWLSGNANCKYGSCLQFNGATQYIKSVDAPFDLTTAITLESWVMFSNLAPGGYQTIMAKVETGAYGLRFNNTDLEFWAYIDGNYRVASASTAGMIVNQWYHLAATYDASAKTGKLFRDGQEIASFNYAGASPNITPTNEPLTIGANPGGGGTAFDEFFNGRIDEPRIWDKALTQEEIISAMSQECKTGGAGATLQCTNDVAGVWNFDDGSGNLATDGSRNRNNGVLMNGPVWNTTGCQFGSCLNFDGAIRHDYIDIGDSLDDIFAGADKKFSVEAWVKPGFSAMIDNIILGKHGDSSCGEDQRQFLLELHTGGRPEFFWQNLADNNYRGVIGSTPITNTAKWYHIAATYDGSIDANNGLDRVKIYVDGKLETTSLSVAVNALPDIQDGTAHFGIGNILSSSGVNCNNATNFSGLIDEVRIYNRALSATEIENTYQKSMTQCVEATLMCSDPELTAVWKMDEGIGVVAGDSTKNNLDGVLKNGLNNTVDNAVDNSGWASGADCKFTDGKCLEFDGIDNAVDGDYIRVPDSSMLDFGADPFTIEGWVKMPTPAISGNIIGKQSGGGGPGFTIHTSPDGRLMFRASPGGDDTNRQIWSPPIDDDAWHHFAAVREGTAIRIYINGIRAGEAPIGTSTPEVNSSTVVNVNNDRPLYIGLYRNPIDDAGWASPFKGSLDELRIWKKALTDNQIQSIYNGGNGQQCLAPQKGSACDLDLVAPMCQPNVGLCESGDPDLRCSIKSCTCQPSFAVVPPPTFAPDSGGKACRNTAITVNFNEPIDAATIKTATTNVVAKSPPLLSENFEAGLPAGWIPTKTDTGAEVLNWQGIAGQLYSLTGSAAGWLSSPNALSSTTNFRISFDTGSLGDGNNAIGIAWNYIDKDNYYRLIWEDPTDSYASLYPSRLVLQKRVNGALVENASVTNSDIVGRGLVESGSFVALVNQLVHFYIDVVGTKITVSNDSGVLLEYNDSSAPAILPGKIAFYTNDNDGGIFYDNLVVTEYEATNIPGTVELYAVQPATSNLLAGGDMEDSKTDIWKQYETPKVIEKSTVEKKSGKQSLHIITDLPDGSHEGVYATIGIFNPGDRVRVKGWVKVVKGNFTAATSYTSASWAASNSGPFALGSWREFTVDLTWPSLSPAGPLSLWFAESGAPDSEFYVDDISVTVEHNLAVDISTAVNGSQLTITPRQYLDADRNYTLNFAGDHLVSLWNFEEGSGTTVKDLHGTNNGTLAGPPLWKSGADCKFGSCLEFDGKDGIVQYVNAGDFTGLYSNQLTVSAWIKNNSSRAGMTGNNPNWDDIIAGDCGDFVFSAAGGGMVTLQSQCGSANPAWVQKAVTSSKSVRDDKWHHVAATYDGSTLKMYIDGKQDGETTGVSGAYQAGIVSIGNSFNHNDELFSGRIDDARIWSRALTDKEIADVANGGAPNPGNGNVIFSSNGNPLENDYVWNGLTTGTEICKIGKAEIEFSKVSGGGKIYYKGSDSFTCAGASCADDISGMAGNQHQSRVNVYSVNGGPLGGVPTYNWTKSADAPFDIWLPATLEPLITPQSVNGQGVLTVDVDGGLAGTAKASANVTIALCENPWIGNQASVPWTESTTNFSTWYCRDAGNMQDTTDDLPNLTVQEVTMSPGSPKPMKEYFYYDADSVNDAIGIRVYANPGRLPLTEWLDQNANVSGGQSGSFNGWQSVKAGRSLYVSAMNDVGSGIYNNIYLISYSDKSSGTLIGIYNQMISNWKFMVNGISDADIAKLQRDIRRIDDLGKIATALDNYKAANGSYPKLDAGTYLPGMSTSVWPSWQASFGNALQTSIPKDPINTLGNLMAYWKFDEGTGIAAKDSSINAFDGRIEGNDIKWAPASDCKVGGCLDFGTVGHSSVIRVPREAMNGLDDFTEDFWIKTSGVRGAVISGCNSIRCNEATFYWDEVDWSGLIPMLKDSNDNAGISIKDNLWHHIAWVRNGSESKLYIDGVLKHANTGMPVGALNIDPGGLVIGQEQDTVGGTFNPDQSLKGSLDELRIWNRALSGSEIALLAGGGFADATGWNQDTNSFRCDAGTDFDSHIYHYQYNNTNSYDLYGALEYVGPVTGNTWRQTTMAAPFNACTNPSDCACYNYKVGPISCSDPNLKAVWKFDEASGNVAIDSSANNDGTLFNGPTRLSSDCKFGSCLNFDKTNDYVDIPGSYNSAQGSIELWVKPKDSSQTGKYIVMFGDGYGSHFDKVAIGIDGGNNYYFGFYGMGGSCAGWHTIASAVKAVNVYAHITGTWDGAGIKLYINGNYIGDGTNCMAGITNTPAAITIGDNTYGANFDGIIDEVRLWNKALTQNEIISAMKQSCVE